MAHPILSRFRFLALLTLAAGLLLGGCCANNVCECDDAKEDVVELRFVNFAPADLDTVVIQRFPRPLPTGARPEIVTLIRSGTHTLDSIQINNTTPFPQIGTTRLGEYSYTVKYYVAQPASKPVLTPLYSISSLRVRGNVEAKACCTCYTNTEKTVNARREGVAQDSVFDLKQAPYVLKVRK